MYNELHIGNYTTTMLPLKKSFFLNVPNIPIVCTAQTKSIPIYHDTLKHGVDSSYLYKLDYLVFWNKSQNKLSRMFSDSLSQTKYPCTPSFNKKVIPHMHNECIITWIYKKYFKILLFKKLKLLSQRKKKKKVICISHVCCIYHQNETLYIFHTWRKHH